MVKRGNGEGSIYESNGRLMVSVTLHDGRRAVRKLPKGATEADARRRLRQLLAERDDNALEAAKAPTVEAWAKDWLADLTDHDRVRPKTLAGYRSNVNQWIVPTLGKKRVDDLTAADVQKLHRVMRGDDKAARTIQYAHATLALMLEQAMRHDHVHRNVARLVDPPPVRRDEVVPHTAEEARLVLEAAADDRNRVRWALAYLGLRQGEALGLTQDRVMLQDIRDAGLIVVKKALQRVTGKGLVLVDVKSTRSNRVLPLPGAVVRMMRQHLAELDDARAREGKRWRDREGLIFTTVEGRPIAAEDDRDAWYALLERAGVRQIKLHDARHTAASLLLEYEIDPRSRMEWLGHSRPEMNAHYTHVASRLLEHVADAFDEGIFGAVSNGDSDGGASGRASSPKRRDPTPR